MTGRARGRSRGRGRGSAQDAAARRPGETHEAPAAAPPVHVGRGRASRGPPPQAASAPPPARPQEPSKTAPPTQQMSRMAVGERPQEERPRRNRFTEPVTRPASLVSKVGIAGQPVPILTNHFKLKKRPNFAIYQYNVSFSPEVEMKKARIGLVGAQRDMLGEVRAFDGMILYLPKKLPEVVTTVHTTRRRRGTGEKPVEEPVDITFTLTNELPADSPIIMQLYNVIMRKLLKCIEMVQVGRDFYHVSRAIQIPRHNMELWPGYTTSIQALEEDVLLCADVSHKILRTDTVLDWLYQFKSKYRGNSFYEDAEKKLIGQIMITRYNNKTYRIDGIDWDKRPDQTFETRNGPISYREYVAKHYDKHVNDPEQPLLMNRPKKIPGKPQMVEQLFFLPEFCYMTGLSDDTRADFQVMRDLAVHTRVSPQDRHKSLQNFINDLNGNPAAAKELNGWNMGFEKGAEVAKGRVLPGEVIFQKSAKFGIDPKSAEWTREMRGNALTSTVALQNWILLHTSRDSGIARDFTQTLKNVCGPMGIKCADPTYAALQNDRADTYLNEIKAKLNDATQMVVTIVPTNRKDRYDAIKKLCCLERPVPSQVVVSRTLSKKQMLMSVCTKIGIQLNCKLGGEAWALEIPLKNLMVIGVDTYHDSATKGQSVGGFCATLNQTLTKYYSRVTFQHTGMELVDQLKICLSAALRKYQDVNGLLPDRIILYRDGVGDSQLAAVVEHEVPQFLETFKGMNSGETYTPKFAAIVVKKRISTRLYSQDRNNRLNNPMPGTVVDNAVTRKEWFDFFLVSQSVRQGTVTPTSYNVIHDTTGLKPDHFQRLTYKLTHLYYNWPGTIRVPAPCQYAHKLAFLVGQSLHRAPDLALADKLFFL